MLGVHPEHSYHSTHAAELQAKAEDASNAFEACFSTLRGFRVALMAASKAVAPVQDPLEKYKKIAVDALDASTWGDLAFDLKHAANGDASDKPGAAASVAAMDALKLAVLALPERREVSQALLTRPTSRPISRLASTMQARDSVEQRISHVMSGYELAVMTTEPIAIDMTRVLAAQISSIAEALREASTTISESSEALKDAFPEMFSEGLAIASVVEAFQALKDGLTGTGKDAEASAWIDAEMSPYVDGEDCPVGTHGSAYTDMISMLEKMEAEAEVIEGIAQKFEAISEAMAKDLPDEAEAAAGTAETESNDLDTLKNFYTSEIEHAIHKSISGRS